MAIGEILLLVVLGLAGGVVSGMFGIGGAILVIPMLLYVPPLFGIPALPMGDITGVTIAQVFAASAAGLSGHRRAGNVDSKLVLLLGIPIVFGSFLGAVVSSWLPDALIKAVYTGVALLATVMMVRPRPEAVAGEAPATYNKPLAATIAFAVGILAGMVGVGGAFVLLPVMVGWMRVPMRLAVGSSLGIVVLSSISGLVGKIVTHQVLWLPTVCVVAGAIIGGRLGARISHRLPVTRLRWGLVVMLCFVVVRLTIDLLT